MSLKEKEIVGLQQELNEVKEQMAQLQEENDFLKLRVDSLESELANLFNPLEAMSVVRAIENRLINKILQGASQKDMLRYKRIDDIIEDDVDNELPDYIGSKWENYKKAWNKKAMQKIFKVLNGNRCAVCHREERQPELYSCLGETQIRQQLSPTTTGLKSQEIELIVQLHLLTSTNDKTTNVTSDVVV